MKLLTFAASNSSQSINQMLAIYAANLLQQSMQSLDVEVLDINDYELPLFSLDRENVLGQPSLAKDFFNKIGEADAIIISFAEHNGSYTAAYKNLFDWVSRISQKVFQGKPMVLLAASPGKGGGKNVLEQANKSAPFFDGDVKATFSVPDFFENFDTVAKTLTNRELESKLNTALSTLI